MNERLSRNQLDGENGLKAEKDKDLGNMLKRIEKIKDKNRTGACLH